MSRLLVAPEGAAFADLAAQVIERELEAAVRRDGRASLALAGGATPRPVYEHLAARARAVPSGLWSRTAVFFGDERAVPPDAPDSNFHMAREALLDLLPEPPAAVHAMPALADGAAAIEAYAQVLPASLDVLLVGLGDDGHILSLFPGSALLSHVTGPVAWAEGPVAPRRRLTLTPPAVAAARAVLVLVSGARKAAMVARVLSNAPDGRALPAALVRDRTWILDEPAASRLPPDVLATATPFPEDS